MAPRDGDGLGMAPRPGEPESALIPGMAAPAPPRAKISPVKRFGLFGHVQLGSMPDTSGPGPVALETPLLWGYDFDPATGNARAAFAGIVTINGTPVVAGGVSSFNTRTGAVTLAQADVSAVAVGSFNGRTGAVALTLADVNATGIIPPGTGADFYGTVAPPGWLICDGTAVPRTGANAALFAAIGTTYGAGDGSTTFNLPDSTGRYIAGKESVAGGVRLTAAGCGVDGSVLGANGGNQALASHFHQFTAVTNVGPANGGSSVSGNWNNTGGQNTTATGTGASANVPPVLIANRMIKL